MKTGFVIEDTVNFCEKCGEYMTDDGTCSNPWCPEPIDDGRYINDLNTDILP